MADNFDALTARGYSAADVEGQPVSELMSSMRAWITNHPK
jgi:hypothetical protein